MIHSVNVGLPVPLETSKGRVLSAIGKRPVAGRVAVHPLGLDGDAQADLAVHGGPEQAVYAYPLEHYAAWAAELGVPAGGDGFPRGWFGENLTVQGALETDVHIGDTFRAGTALLQVTKPRSPCFKLAATMGHSDFAKRFLASGRTGYYLRVLTEGEVGAGDAFLLVARDGQTPTVLDDARRRWGKRQ
jgi:MOSC domain-containing protein YiiM